MAISGKYRRIDIPGIGEDEPVFILRAQDRLAPHAIELYSTLADSHGATVAADACREAERFRRWSGSKKLPD